MMSIQVLLVDWLLGPKDLRHNNRADISDAQGRKRALFASFMRQNWLSNRIFKSFDDIVDHCCYAWNTLIDQPWKIMSIARRDWSSVGYSM
jgi:hypothetical protein